MAERALTLDSAPAPPLRDILAGRAAREREIYNVDEISSVLECKHRTEPQVAPRPFHVSDFELWHGIHRNLEAVHLPKASFPCGCES